MSSFSCCIPWSVRWSPSWESRWRLSVSLSTPKAGCWENSSSGVVAASWFNPTLISLDFPLQLSMNPTLLRASSKQLHRGVEYRMRWCSRWGWPSRYYLVMGSSWGMLFVRTWMVMVLTSKTTPDKRAIICSTRNPEENRALESSSSTWWRYFSCKSPTNKIDIWKTLHYTHIHN